MHFLGMPRYQRTLSVNEDKEFLYILTRSNIIITFSKVTAMAVSSEPVPEDVLNCS